MKNKRISKPTGLRKWTRAHVPRLEHFLFDVPWDRRTKITLLILVLVLLGIIFLPVEFVAKWMRR